MRAPSPLALKLAQATLRNAWRAVLRNEFGVSHERETLARRLLGIWP